jgi:hypothetical protein
MPSLQLPLVGGTLIVVAALPGLTIVNGEKVP